jgi:hypothetical protein
MRGRQLDRKERDNIIEEGGYKRGGMMAIS